MDEWMKMWYIFQLKGNEGRGSVLTEIDGKDITDAEPN